MVHIARKFIHFPTYIYIYNIQGFTKTFSKMYPPISLRNIICSILKPRIWINHYVSIQFSPTYLSWQSSLKSFRVTIVYVSRKETKFEKQPITQSEKLLVSFSDRSLLPLSLHFCLINTSFFTPFPRNREFRASTFHHSIMAGKSHASGIVARFYTICTHSSQSTMFTL